MNDKKLPDMQDSNAKSIVALGKNLEYEGGGTYSMENNKVVVTEERINKRLPEITVIDLAGIIALVGIIIQIIMGGEPHMILEAITYFALGVRVEPQVRNRPAPPL